MNNNPSFIEVQFPVSKLSKESYKERKSGDSQTLASLGKWHGRKPLVLVRALILGLLMPATDDPKKDREVFLKSLTMDDEGMWSRFKGMTAKEVAPNLTPTEQLEALAETNGRVGWVRGLSDERKQSYLKRAFLRMSYDERLKCCLRPEEISGPSESSWKEINAHLGTSANTVAELVQELGKKKFGHIPRVGDAFAGGGSIPYEAARIGCDVLANDLNPTSTLMNHGALGLIGGSQDAMSRAKQAQREVYNELRKQVKAWKIEQNEWGWEADVYLYCNEVLDPTTGWRVPMLPSFAIDPGEGAIVEMEPNHHSKTIQLHVKQGVSDEELAHAAQEKTSDDGVRSPYNIDGEFVPPSMRQTVSGVSLRGQHGLRMWEKSEWRPRPADVYQERLFCIRWTLPDLVGLLAKEQVLKAGKSLEGWNPDTIATAIDSVLDLLSPSNRVLVQSARTSGWASSAAKLVELEESFDSNPDSDAVAKDAYSRSRQALVVRLDATVRAGLEACSTQPSRVYREPSQSDLDREKLVESLLSERFDGWQQQGMVPERPIERGEAINRPTNARGFTHWHHLYMPRQLLLNGLFASHVMQRSTDPAKFTALLLSQMKLADWSAKLCRWNSRGGAPAQVFYGPLLPTPFPNWVCRASRQLESITNINMDTNPVIGSSSISLGDAAQMSGEADLWITDPGYGDMVPYAEFSELFLAWVDRLLPLGFPGWYGDSKRALAVELAGESFAAVLHRCYANLVSHMPDNGLQIVMFTQQDAQVWADLTLLLWAAGLHVIQAWTIATETSGEMRQGNFVQGTVFLVLRKRQNGVKGDLSDIRPEVQLEVRHQLKTMLALDDRESPNFSDSDYQLAAYAAALRVITSYESISELDVSRELARGLRPDPNGIVKGVIDHALREASDFLVPAHVENSVWKRSGPEERLYLKGIDVESHGEKRTGVYAEFARGFGVTSYRDLLQSEAANEARLKTPSELRGRNLDSGSLGASLLRNVLYAVYQTASEQNNPEPALKWLIDRYPGTQFDDLKKSILNLLGFLVETPSASMTHWKSDSEAARVFRARLENWGR